MKKTHYIHTLAAAFASMALMLAPGTGSAVPHDAAGHTGMQGRTCPAAQPATDADTVISEQDTAWPWNVRSRLEELLDDDMLQTSMVGIMVYDLTADSAIFKYNERQLMRPASTLKMMVAVAALDRLGEDYEYKTTLAYTGRIDGNVLDGDLYCKGDLDPMFGNADLDTFADSLRSLGVDTITGGIYADRSMKDDNLLGEGWCWDDDNPVLSPLLVSRKDEFTGRLKIRLERAGITVKGDTATASMPRRARTVCTVARPLGDILPRMMKKSDNLYAESVFYHLAASANRNVPATAKAGRMMVNRLVTKLGFNTSDYYIADGSGLSLYNYVSPELEVAFLKYAYGKDKIFLPLYRVMPVAGMDGTLGSRMKRGYARDNVHAKTGTVTGVSALAGYCTAANGHKLCFSIINMGIRESSTGRRFQDRVCEALCRP